jgi:hypothetical protein
MLLQNALHRLQLPAKQLKTTVSHPSSRFGQTAEGVVIQGLQHGIQEELKQAYQPLKKHGAAITKRLDPVNLFETTWNQAKVVYALCIASRIGIGFQRSHHKDGKNIWEKLGNETCEVLRRDPWGWLFWFYAADFTQRLYTQAFVPKQYRTQLLHYPEATSKPWVKHNPLHWNQTTPKQLRERHAFMLKHDTLYASRIQALEEAKVNLAHLRQQKASAPLIQEAKQTLLTLSQKHPSLELAAKYGDLVGLAGIVTAIALNGIGIPVTNILITKRNVKRKAEELHAQAQPPLAPPPATSFATSGVEKPTPSTTTFTPLSPQAVPSGVSPFKVASTAITTTPLSPSFKPVMVQA